MKSASAELIQTNGTLQLSGQINLHSVNRLYEIFKHEWGTGIDVLDCREISDADSSAISFLLACKHFAKEHDRKLRVTGMGDQIITLARLYGVSALLTAD